MMDPFQSSSRALPPPPVVQTRTTMQTSCKRAGTSARVQRRIMESSCLLRVRISAVMHAVFASEVTHCPLLACILVNVEGTGSVNTVRSHTVCTRVSKQ